MTLVMTLLARDEADIVDAQIAFHLHAGVDFVIATDNRSTDGTTEILERYERAGCLRLLREPGDDWRQQEWVTRMARLAATEHGADWVINSDADEFWWPREGSLKEVLAAVPERFGVVRGFWRHFLPRPDDGAFFAERMTARLRTPARVGSRHTVYHAHYKAIHRARPDVRIGVGNHTVAEPQMRVLRSWYPIEVLHFTFRSLTQLERKARSGWIRSVERPPTLQKTLLHSALREGRTGALYDSLSVDGETLARGLAEGRLAIDLRLRDALRCLRREDGVYTLPERGSSLAFARPSSTEDAEFACEVAPVMQVDAVSLAMARVDELETRLSRIERDAFGRLRRLVRR